MCLPLHMNSRGKRACSHKGRIMIARKPQPSKRLKCEASKSLCNSYNNDLATISKSYSAERHISCDLDAIQTRLASQPLRHLTWQKVRINSAEVLAKQAAGNTHAPAPTLEHSHTGRCPHANATDDRLGAKAEPPSKMFCRSHHRDGHCTLRNHQRRLAC